MTGNPVLVSPEAPAGVQNAPAVTSLTTSRVALGVGEAVVASGVGEAVGSTVGVGETVVFATATPLFQTNLPLLFIHVYLMPPLTLEVFSGLHAVPLFIAPNALTGTTRNDAEITKARIFFMPRFYF